MEEKYDKNCIKAYKILKDLQVKYKWFHYFLGATNYALLSISYENYAFNLHRVKKSYVQMNTLTLAINAFGKNNEINSNQILFKRWYLNCILLTIT